MLRHPLLVLLFCALSNVAAGSAPLSVLMHAEDTKHYGAGVEWAFSLGRHSLLGTEVDWLSSPTASRQFKVSLNARRLFTASVTTQWYPLASVQYSMDTRKRSSGFGGGAQYELSSVVSLFSQGQWYPATDGFQVQLGLRLNLNYFTQLDARMTSTDPQGAVYINGPRANATVELSAAEVEENPIPLTSELTGPIPPDEPMAGQWYVHLGLFEYKDSMADILMRLHALGYEQNTLRWYDASRNMYRLLLGPYAPSEAEVMLQKLKKQKIEGFLFQKK